MSKAEDRFFDYFLDGRLRNFNNKDAFLYGYQQAEKDLALTIEDIEKIDNLLWNLSSKWSDKNDNAGYFQEVLNQFNKQKEK